MTETSGQRPGRCRRPGQRLLPDCGGAAADVVDPFQACRIVSAGGLVARVYLQDALPGVEYRGDVDRLITIATPHLGSALAEHFGDIYRAKLAKDHPYIRNVQESLLVVEEALAADG